MNAHVIAYYSNQIWIRAGVTIAIGMNISS